MADSPLQSIEACEGGRRVTQNGNKIISSGVTLKKTTKLSPQKLHQDNPNKRVPSNGWTRMKNCFYDLFAEREHSTKKPTKTNIPAEPITPEQDKTQENKTPCVTPAKEIDSTPLPQRPHRPKNVLRGLSETQSTPASARRKMCKPKTFAELLGTKIDETVHSIAKTRKRRAVKYPKRFVINDE